MAKLILHEHPLSAEELNEQRLMRALEMSPRERFSIAIQLIGLSLRFTKNDKENTGDNSSYPKKRP